MHRLLAILAFAGTVTLTGCMGSNSVSPKPAALAMKTYHDQRVRFSFRYPGAWSVAKHGHVVRQNGQTQYVLPINTHDTNVQLEIEVDGHLVQIPTVTQGNVGTSPSGSRYRYYNMRISGYLALQGQRLFKGNRVDDIETVVNTHSLGFNVRMLTAFPPFSSSVTRGYNVIVHTMKLPF